MWYRPPEVRGSRNPLPPVAESTALHLTRVTLATCSAKKRPPNYTHLQKLRWVWFFILQSGLMKRLLYLIQAQNFHCLPLTSRAKYETVSGKIPQELQPFSHQISAKIKGTLTSHSQSVIMYGYAYGDTSVQVCDILEAPHIKWDLQGCASEVHFLLHRKVGFSILEFFFYSQRFKIAKLFKTLQHQFAIPNGILKAQSKKNITP